MSITQYVKGLYWFLEPVPQATVIKQAGMCPRTFRLLSYCLRTMMFEKMEAFQASAPMLGGEGRAVCIDETYFTKKSAVEEVLLDGQP